MRTSEMIVALAVAGTLAFGVGTALAASANTAIEASKAPAAVATTPGAKTPAVKTATKESPATQNSEKALETGIQISKNGERTAEGIVTHVDQAAVPPTVVMKTAEGAETVIVGADITGRTIIREGKNPMTLKSLERGDRVSMRWHQTPKTLVADEINLLAVHSKAASMATPAGEKTAMAKQNK
jgi:hypothetical protein